MRHDLPASGHRYLRLQLAVFDPVNQWLASQWARWRHRNDRGISEFWGWCLVEMTNWASNDL